VNKSRDEIAYNIIDIEGDFDASLQDKISAVEGVVHVRLI
jgi:D-3-phosphoglycerate dehydrogenase